MVYIKLSITKELKPYWINTASNDLIKYHFYRLLRENFEKPTSLINGDSINTYLYDSQKFY